MNIKVALFEDNDRLRKGLQLLIDGSKGFRCVGAFPNCSNLIENIRELNPDVVLMDIQMPGISGIDGVRMIKENFPEIKILMQTIFEEDEKIFASICNGAEGYILKNTPPALLLQSLRELYDGGAEILEAIREIHEGGSPMTPSVANRVLKMVKNKSIELYPDSFDLTRRETEILSGLVKGMSYKMISDACTISMDTVSMHIKNIYRKLQVHSKSEAVVKAIRGKIV
ncbi:MAG: response regulator transcription factor [Chitinophagales bacterium]|nr:response regulator transcription factor [Chitinophagales bacterium]